MSSIIRWRKPETLRTVGMGQPNEVVLLMASNGIEKLHRTTGWSSFAYINRNRAKKVAGNRIPAQRVSTRCVMWPPELCGVQGQRYCFDRTTHPRAPHNFIPDTGRA